MNTLLRSNFPMAAFLLLFTSTCLAAPNLVPNPSFSNAAQCPDDIDTFTGQIDFAAPWFSAGSTPDFFHGCGLTNSVEVPANAFGQECPWGEDCNGSQVLGGYAGIVLWIDNCDFCREYIQVPLNQTLQAGVSYRVEFYVSLSEFSKYGIDRIGAYLSDGAVADIDDVLPFTPQVESEQGLILSQKDGWTKISGKFTAAGGEDHLVLGNFREDFEMQTELSASGGTFDHAYYYVDMVSVRKADITDIAIPDPGDGSGGMSTVLANAEPSSPAILYCGGDLDTRHENGHVFDLGDGAHVLATAITDRFGEATFFWNWADGAACANASGVFYLEARVDGPLETTDSNEIPLQIQATSSSRVALGSRLGELSASPNPFNPRTTLSYELKTAGPVEIQIYDARGRGVRTLARGLVQPAGTHRAEWNGRNDAGQTVSTGVYYARVSTPGEAIGVSLVLVK